MAGNLATLNIDVTSNIQAAQQQLRSLQGQLRGITSTRVGINTTIAQTSFKDLSRSLSALTKTFSGMTAGLTDFGAGFDGIGASASRGARGVKDLAASMFVFDRLKSKLTSGPATPIYAKPDISKVAFNLIDSEDTFGKAFAMGKAKEYVEHLSKFAVMSAQREGPKMTSRIANFFGFDRIFESIKQRGISAQTSTFFGSQFLGHYEKNLKIAQARVRTALQIRRDLGVTRKKLLEASRDKGYEGAEEAARLLPATESMIDNLTQMLTPFRQQFAQLRAGGGFQEFKKFLAGATALTAGLVAKLTLLGGAITLVSTAIKVGIFKKVIEDGIRFNTVLEQITTSYRVMLGAEKEFMDMSLADPTRIKAAENIVKQMQNFATFTPMLTRDLAEAGTTLMRFGVESSDLLPILSAMGEVTGGDPERLKRMARSVGQTIGFGRLTGQDRMQLVNIGFNPVKYIAEDMDKSMTEVEEAISRGEIGADKLLKALQRAADTDFSGYMEEQSRTLAGRLSTLNDVWQIFAGNVSKPIFDSLKTSLEYVIKGFNHLSNDDTLEEITAQIQRYVIPAFNELGRTLMWILDLKGEMDMTDEATSTIKSVGAMIESVSLLAKMFHVVKLVSTSLWLSFRTGIEAVVLLITAAVEGIYNVIRSIIDFIISGVALIGGVFEGLFRGIQGGAIYAAGLMIEQFEKAAEIVPFVNIDKAQIGLGRDLMEEGAEMTAGAFTVDNAAFRQAGESFRNAIGRFSAENWDFTSVMWDMLNESAERGWEEFKKFGELGDLFGSKQMVNDLLKQLDEAPDRSAPEFDDIDYEKFARDLQDAADAAERLTSAMEQVQDSVSSALNSLVNFGNVFERLTYERFSPAKLLARIRRFFREISSWSDNLAALEGRVSESVLHEIRGMGISGFGITSALARARPEQLEEINALYDDIRLAGLNEVVKSIQFEHSGTVLVKGVNTLGELKGVVSMIAKDIANEKNLISTDPALADIFSK